MSKVITTVAVFIMLFSEVFSKDTCNKCNLNMIGSLNSSLINARKGPGSEYPIVCVYRRKYLPIKIVAEFNNWYQVEDHEGVKTWISKNLVSINKKTVIVKNDTILYKSGKADSAKLARLEKGVVAIIEKDFNKKFIKIKINTLKGWVLRNDVYGVKL